MAEKAALQINETEGITVVTFRDASILDTLTTQRVGRELYEVVETRGRSKVVLDFSSVRFLSSQTLGVLLTLRRKADKGGVKVVLASIRPELVRVFEITNLNKLFDFYDSAAEAISALQEA